MKQCIQIHTHPHSTFPTSQCFRCSVHNAHKSLNSAASPIYRIHWYKSDTNLIRSFTLRFLYMFFLLLKNKLISTYKAKHETTNRWCWNSCTFSSIKKNHPKTTYMLTFLILPRQHWLCFFFFWMDLCWLMPESKQWFNHFLIIESVKRIRKLSESTFCHTHM